MNNNYQILITKLDEFIRKYYKNLLIKGTLYCISALLLFYLLITVFEYFGHFGTLVRTIIFYTYLLLNLGIIYNYFIIPLLKLYHIGKIISHEQASYIIGKHFTDVGDKLLNTLQLKALYDTNPANTELINASINQKIFQINPIPFNLAIDLKNNRKYLKYAVFPFLVLVILLFAAPSIITDSTKRLVNHATFYEREAPFQFVIQNNKLEALQQEDFILKIKLTGNEIPEMAYLDIDGNRFQLSRDNTVNFHYNFKNIQKTTKFQLFADGYYSKQYEINVLVKPIVLNFDVDLIYPAYINKKNESIQNTGDMLIPEGTKVNWHFITKDTKKISLRFKDNLITTDNIKQNNFSYSAIIKNSQNYSIIPTNDFVAFKDTLAYTISVIPDAYPSIKVVEFKDSIYENRSYYKGMIKDDYGFKALIFNYRKINNSDTLSSKKSGIKIITINNSLTQQEFFHYFDFSTLTAEPGDEYEYYFEVWDNDGVNGSKSTRSQKFTYKSLSLQELQDKTEKSNEQIKNDLTQSLAEAKQLQKDIQEFNKKLLEKKTISWQEKKQMQDILDKQLKLQNKMDMIQKENIEKSAKENQYKKDNEELLKKQEELNKLFNELMTDEMKEMFKKIQEMMDKLDKDKVTEMLDKMKLSNKDLEKQLDRNLELFKQLEFEKKLSETIENLNKLSEKQENLSKETEKDNNKTNDNLNSKQEDLNKEFENVKKDLNDIEKKNEELEEPNKLEKTDEQQNKIQEEMKNSLENLSNNKNKKASQLQENAADDMKELSKKLEEMQQEMESESQAENIDALRDILENLVKASFDQENLMTEFSEYKASDPKFVSLMQKQKKLNDDLKMIEDSLFALSKRQSEIESFVNKEISEINDNVDKAITALIARNISVGKAKQQSAMTSINNLALMLSETLSDMQQQMNQKSSGSCKKKNGSCKKPGSCSKPGTGEPSFKSMRQLQEQLNKQMQELKNGMNPNGKDGQKSISEQLAKLAAQQEALRNQLQQLIDELKKDGNTNTGGLKDLQKKMEQTETELVNKIISNETLKRQKEILTRLLESEKAEKEQEFEEKRESKEGKNENYRNPANFFEYNSNKLKEVELLETVPLSLKTFYKNKVNEYFYNFEH